MRYWYMVMCHELAHNNVSAHNEEHEVRHTMNSLPSRAALHLSLSPSLTHFSALVQSLLSWLAFRHMESLNTFLNSQRLPQQRESATLV
jgi:hypothetical protein